MQAGNLRVYNPEPAIYWVTENKLAPRHASLEGKRIGILRYGHPSKSIDEEALLANVRRQSGAASVAELIKEALAPWPMDKLEAAARDYDAIIACSAQ